jgi:hypothetical protein
MAFLLRRVGRALAPGIVRTIRRARTIFLLTTVSAFVNLFHFIANTESAMMASEPQDSGLLLGFLGALRQISVRRSCGHSTQTYRSPPEFLHAHPHALQRQWARNVTERSRRYG